MKHALFLKYLSLFLCVMLLGFAALAGGLLLSVNHYESTQDTTTLQVSAAAARQSLHGLFSLTGKGFDRVLRDHETLVWDILRTQAEETGYTLFLTDQIGEILMSTDATLLPGQLSTESMTEAQQADGMVFSSALTPLFPKDYQVQAVFLEEGVTPVGALFVCAEQTVSPLFHALIQSLALASILLAVAAALLFFHLYRKLFRPIALLHEACLSYMEGDFTKSVHEKAAGEILPLVRLFNDTAQTAALNEEIHQSFLSNVSHDLRTPLTSIAGFVQNMKEGAIPPEKTAHYYDVVLSEVDRLHRLVEALLESARSQSGTRRYKMEALDLCELACVTLLCFEQGAEKKKLQVSFSCDRDDITVKADADAIRQVIYNLTDNAVKFTPLGGKITMSIRIHGKKAIFSLKNTGDGIPNEELRHLFERFYKSDRSRNLDKQGTGLGLSIAKAIITDHKEEIWVESMPGEYTEFFFSLPLTKESKSRDRRENA